MKRLASSIPKEGDFLVPLFISNVSHMDDIYVYSPGDKEEEGMKRLADVGTPDVGDYLIPEFSNLSFTAGKFYMIQNSIVSFTRVAPVVFDDISLPRPIDDLDPMIFYVYKPNDKEEESMERDKHKEEVDITKNYETAKGYDVCLTNKLSDRQSEYPIKGYVYLLNNGWMTHNWTRDGVSSQTPFFDLREIPEYKTVWVVIMNDGQVLTYGAYSAIPKSAAAWKKVEIKTDERE